MNRSSRRANPRKRQPASAWDLGLFVALAGLSTSCKDPPQKPPTEVAAPDAPAPDRLTPGQLLEGDDEVFGLRLPEHTTLLAVFRTSASVEGPYDPLDLAAYLKPRLDASHVEMAGDHILFPKARIRGAKDELFRIEIAPAPRGTSLQLRNITPLRAEQGLSEAERWRKAGLAPDGRLLDPNGME